MPALPPELAPGSAPVDDAQRIARQLLARLDEEMLAATSLDHFAAQFELSGRQIRRIVQKAYGVSPIQLLQTRRLLLAKQLLTQTSLPMAQVAFSSGFRSVRRFNDVFSSRYRMPPSQLRKRVAARTSVEGTSTVQLAYRPPYDWPGILAFLRTRTLRGAEWCSDTAYSRTVRLGDHAGWVQVKQETGKHALVVEFSNSLAPVLAALLRRLRHLFDLDARPDLIATHLMQDSRLRSAVQANPGLRVPGAFDGFELALRAILGQQVTVEAATTLASRITETFGTPMQTPYHELTRQAPTAEQMANASAHDVAKHGIVGARAKTIVGLAQAYVSGRVQLCAGAHPDTVFARLRACPGIGPWTAHYIAMRALRWPDAFPKEDIAVRKKLGGVTPGQAEATLQAWRPWRSYAVLHLWNSEKVGDII